MTLDTVEAIIWSQARNLNSADTLVRRTAMDAVRTAIAAHAEQQAGPIVAARQRALREAS